MRALRARPGLRPPRGPPHQPPPFLRLLMYVSSLLFFVLYHTNTLTFPSLFLVIVCFSHRLFPGPCGLCGSQGAARPPYRRRARLSGGGHGRWNVHAGGDADAGQTRQWQGDFDLVDVVDVLRVCMHDCLQAYVYLFFHISFYVCPPSPSPPPPHTYV